MALRDDARAQAMYDAYQAGATLTAVGQQFGVGQSVVSRIFQLRGWPVRPRPVRPPSEVQRAAKLAGMTARHAARRAEIDALKLGSGCTDCGYNGHPAALQFDHLEGATKRFILSKNLSRAWPDVLAEIAKCEVVCANCHAIRTATRGYRTSAG